MAKCIWGLFFLKKNHLPEAWDEAKGPFNS